MAKRKLTKGSRIFIVLPNGDVQLGVVKSVFVHKAKISTSESRYELSPYGEDDMFRAADGSYSYFTPRYLGFLDEESAKSCARSRYLKSRCHEISEWVKLKADDEAIEKILNIMNEATANAL
jgi:hypothetical protein